MTNPEQDKHHLLFPRKLWDAHPETKKLRRIHGLIPVIDKAAHLALHKTVGIVPVLDRFTCEEVNGIFVPTEHTIENIHNLCQAISTATVRPSSGMIERSNARVAIQALEAQIPFLLNTERTAT